MPGPLVYVDTSEVRDGALAELKEAIAELVEFIEVNEPRLLAYAVYLSEDGSQMTVLHVHADSASLEHHLDIGGPAFKRFKDLLTLSSIRVYGEPSKKAVRQLHDKAAMLGPGEVAVHPLEAGFSRFGDRREPSPP
jgi:quinol monooxygenase YgiN